MRCGGVPLLQTRSIQASLATEMPVFNAHSAGVAAASPPLTFCREQPRIVIVVLSTLTPQLHSYARPRCILPRQLPPLSTSARFRTLAQLLQLPPSADVMFFGGEGSHLLLHALHVALAEFSDAGYIVAMSDSAVLHLDRVAEHIEFLDLSSCSPALLFRPHTLGHAILTDPIFADSAQSSLSSAAFASLDDGFLVTRASAEAMLAERRRWLQVILNLFHLHCCNCGSSRCMRWTLAISAQSRFECGCPCGAVMRAISCAIRPVRRIL